jgi:predicted alpha/beta hydrolase
VLINAATGVAARYYARFAEALAAAGYCVLTYDYRGIGRSRPARLRGLRATKLDWGALDCEGALAALAERSPGLPLDAVCHSIGGFALGLAPRAAEVRRALFVGCQYAYWRDYAPHVRWPYLLRWHAFMPAVSGLLGYFPGKRLGWLEDLPQGVALEWAFRVHPRFHRFYGRLPHASGITDGPALERRMANVRADILAVADVEDQYATPAACRRLLEHFGGSRRAFVQLDLAREGLPPMGHFGFFHARYRDSLWPRALDWLATGEAPWAPQFTLP